jgi:hypothetical protein
MKARLMAGVLAVAMAVSFAFAEDVTPSIGAGSKGMIFSFSGLSNLGVNNFNGGLGGKYFLSEALALRASLMFAHAGQEDLANPPTGAVGTDGSRSATEFGITLGAEYHLLKSRVSPYVGAELGFSSASTEQKSAGSAIPPAVYTQTVTKNATGGLLGYYGGSTLGIAALIGVEFFVTKELSLAGEYQLGYGMSARADQEVTTGPTTTTTKTGATTGIGISTTALTLAVYF